MLLKTGLQSDCLCQRLSANLHLPSELRQITALPSVTSITSSCSPAVTGRSTLLILGTEHSAVAVLMTLISLSYCGKEIKTTSYSTIVCNVFKGSGEGGREEISGWVVRLCLGLKRGKKRGGKKKQIKLPTKPTNNNDKHHHPQNKQPHAHKFKKMPHPHKKAPATSLMKFPEEKAACQWDISPSIAKDQQLSTMHLLSAAGSCFPPLT